MKNIKEKIINMLLSTEREGMKNLISYMEESGFFTAPCSGGNHLATEGGLAEHSLNVWDIMDDVLYGLGINGELPVSIDHDSVVIVSLLHDLGKMGDHGKPNYTPNFVRSKTKNKETGEYDMVQSTAKPYETNKELIYIPHEVRSVMIAERFIKLTEEEEQAILYHNGLYSTFKYEIPNKETPLYLALHFADLWASRVTEIIKEEE